MKKLLSLALVLFLACSLSAAVAEEDIYGDWFSSYGGIPMTLTLGTDGTAKMVLSGFEGAGAAGSATWELKDGKIVMKDSVSGDVTEGILEDGKLFLTGGGSDMVFTREPIEGIKVADVNPDAKADDFEGDWTIHSVQVSGLHVEAAAAGMGDVSVKIENSALSFVGNADAVTFFVGTEPVAMTFADGSLTYSIDIPNDSAPVTVTLKAQMLMDGMLSLYIDTGYGDMTLFFTKASASVAE